jgi:hypothetical protein
MRYVTVVLLCLAACGGNSRTYTVDISPDLPDAVQEATLRALADWQRAVPVLFYSRVAYCSPGSDRACIEPVQGRTDSGGVGETWCNYVHHCVASLDVSYRGNMQEIAAHELGHAMGLEHTGAGSLMCWTTLCGSPVVTQRDVAQWIDTR